MEAQPDARAQLEVAAIGQSRVDYDIVRPDRGVPGAELEWRQGRAVPPVHEGVVTRGARNGALRPEDPGPHGPVWDGGGDALNGGDARHQPRGYARLLGEQGPAGPLRPGNLNGLCAGDDDRRSGVALGRAETRFAETSRTPHAVTTTAAKKSATKAPAKRLRAQGFS